MSLINILPSILGAGASIYGTASNRANINDQLSNSLQNGQTQLDIMRLTIENSKIIADQEDDVLKARTSLTLIVIGGILGIIMLFFMLKPVKTK